MANEKQEPADNDLPKKQLNEYARIQEQHLQAFMQSSNPAWICDTATLRILAANDIAVKTYGYRREEFCALHLTDLFATTMQQAVKENPALLAEARTWQHRRKDATQFHVRTFAHYTYFNDRETWYIMAVDVEDEINACRQNEALSRQLHAQQQQLSDILSSIDEVIWSRRADDNTLVYINDACEAIYGYTKEELTGTTGKLEHIHPDDLERLRQEIAKTRATGRGEMEYRLYHKDGTLKHMYGHGILKKGTNGAPDLINGVSMDITPLREAEQKLREINKEMEHIFESINDSFIALDHDFNFTYINKEAAKVYNIKREDLLHKNLWKIYPRGKNLKFYTELHHAMKEQVSVHFEEFSPTANIWVSINAYPTQNGLAIYFSDVTEQRKLQEQLINEGQKLLSIINNTKDIIWSLDKNMNIISANQAYYDRVAYMTGGKDYAALTSEDFDSARLAKWTAYFSRAFSGETFYVVEEEEYKGEAIFDEISFNPIRDKDNNVTGISCFSRNITEQHNQLARIQQQNEKLSEIAWLQSHQVRGPVATILGLVPLFNYEHPADKANIEILEMIRTTAHQLDQNIKEVVNKSRIV